MGLPALKETPAEINADTSPAFLELTGFAQIFRQWRENDERPQRHQSKHP